MTIQNAEHIGLHNLSTGGSFPTYQIDGMVFGDLDGDGDIDGLIATSDR